MRTDLESMSPGRKMAQASHAAHALDNHVKRYGKRRHKNLLRKWKNETEQSFGTAIVLAASSSQITEIISATETYDLEDMEPVVGLYVFDPDYRFNISKEAFWLIDADNENFNCGDSKQNADGSYNISIKQMTCAVVFGEKEFCREYFVKDLPLHP